MPNNSIECLLGRLEESVSNLKEDIKELKDDHKEIKNFVDDQRKMHKYFWFLISCVTGFIYFARDIYEFINKIKHG